MPELKPGGKSSGNPAIFMNLYQQISRNKQRSIFLMLGLLVFVAAAVYVYAMAYGQNPVGMVAIALIVTGLYTLISYYNSDKMILAMSGAKRIDSKHQAPELFNLVENLCIGSGLPRPQIYIIEDSAPNAFATGRDPNHSVVCFTTGILEKLDRAELEGVVAHELSHIKNYDIRLVSLVVILVGVIAFIADMFIRMSWFRSNDRNNNQLFMLVGIVLALVSPIIATIMQMAISRQREFLADASAAELTRNPEGLARALEKISGDDKPLEAANNATASLYISNPLKGEAKDFLSNLFNTHPPIEERVRRLRAM